MRKKIFFIHFLFFLVGCGQLHVTESMEVAKPSMILIKEDFQNFNDQNNLWEHSFNAFDNNYQPVYSVNTTTSSALSGLELSFEGGTKRQLLLLSRKISDPQLMPNNTYTFSIHLDLLTAISNNTLNKGGSPGFDTYIKIGLLNDPPHLTDPYNFHIGLREHSGLDFITFGNVGHYEKNPATGYVLKSFRQTLQGTTDDQGHLWVLIALDGYSQQSVSLILKSLELIVLPDSSLY